MIRDGLRRFSGVHPIHLRPVRPHAAGLSGGGARPEPAAAGPGADFPPAAAVHGLCRLLGGLRLRHRALLAGVWTTRSPVLPPVDAGGVGVLTLGIVLGSAWATSWAGAAGGSGTRWRTPPLLCRGWRAPPCCTRWRSPNSAPAERGRCCCPSAPSRAVPAGHLHGALRGAGVGAPPPTRRAEIFILTFMVLVPAARCCFVRRARGTGCVRG